MSIEAPDTIKDVEVLKESLRKAPSNLRKLSEAIRQGEVRISAAPVAIEEWAKELSKYASLIDKLLATPSHELLGRRIKG